MQCIREADGNPSSPAECSAGRRPPKTPPSSVLGAKDDKQKKMKSSTHTHTRQIENLNFFLSMFNRSISKKKQQSCLFFDLKRMSCKITLRIVAARSLSIDLKLN